MIVADLCELDHRYRAKRTGASKIEYAASVTRYTRPRRQWPAWLATAAVLLGVLWMAGAK